MSHLDIAFASQNVFIPFLTWHLNFEYQTTFPASWEICTSVKKHQSDPDMEQESWGPKNECFWTVLEKTLESPLDCKIKPVSPEGNQSEYSLQGLMLKLKFQYYGHLMWITDSLQKTLILGKIEVRRRRGWLSRRYWMASPIWWTWIWASAESWWWTGRLDLLYSVGSQSQTWLSDWTDWFVNFKWMWYFLVRKWFFILVPLF